ncbi:hypothetical protein CI109_103983 [Kwoniella shandongensis]|uniref:Palmitoyltransferase n=1 Tax=Kwoniella shandongensis TaxID=1734106 RepID=A0AAJ8LKP2_9TREE
MVVANRLLWLVQQLLPPLLLSYFYAAWRIVALEVGPILISQEYDHPILGHIYSTLSSILLGTITIHYLRLYFLPSSQSVPPHDPPPSISTHLTIYECLSPSDAKTIRLNNGESIEGVEDIPLVDRCWKGKCGGRWKPARTRHCSQCGLCRGGFDHHCPFFANCLTAAYIPTFLHLLLYAPPTIFFVSLPLYKPIYHRAIAAYVLSRSSESIRTYWWDWKPSWVVAGGPVGRYVGGLILGWRELDRSAGKNGAGLDRLGVGLMLAFGVILALITTGLAVSTISVLLEGHLTIDRGRHTAHSRTITAIQDLARSGQSIPKKLEDDLLRFSDRTYFFVPFEIPDPLSNAKTHGEVDESHHNDPEEGSRSRPGRKGVIVPALPEERPYDHGRKKNWEIVMGQGWSWLLPWKGLSHAMGEEIFNWPISESVEKRLRAEAERRRDGLIDT